MYCVFITSLDRSALQKIAKISAFKFTVNSANIFIFRRYFVWQLLPALECDAYANCIDAYYIRAGVSAALVRHHHPRCYKVVQYTVCLLYTSDAADE